MPRGYRCADAHGYILKREIGDEVSAGARHALVNAAPTVESREFGDGAERSGAAVLREH